MLRRSRRRENPGLPYGKPLFLFRGSGVRDESYEVGDALDAELGHETPLVRFHRARADAELGGDFAVVASRDNAIENLLLAVGEARELPARLGGLARPLAFDAVALQRSTDGLV